MPQICNNYSFDGEIYYLQGIDENRIHDMVIHMKYIFDEKENIFF